MSNKLTNPVCEVMPFAIEADHPTNSDLMIQMLGNLRLRSNIKAVKDILDYEEGERIVRPVSAHMVDGLPRNIPGMQLYINPGKCTWKMIDPLREDRETCERIQRAMSAQSGMSVSATLRGVPPREGELGVDEMKPLISELVRLIEAREARMIKVSMPAKEDIDELPGDYLLNKSNQGQWNQPRYEKDYEEWRRSLNRIV